MDFKTFAPVIEKAIFKKTSQKKESMFDLVSPELVGGIIKNLPLKIKFLILGLIYTILCGVGLNIYYIYKLISNLI